MPLIRRSSRQSGCLRLWRAPVTGHRSNPGSPATAARGPPAPPAGRDAAAPGRARLRSAAHARTARPVRGKPSAARQSGTAPPDLKLAPTSRSSRYSRSRTSSKSCPGIANSSSIQRATRAWMAAARGSPRPAPRSLQRCSTNASGAAAVLSRAVNQPGTGRPAKPRSALVCGTAATAHASGPFWLDPKPSGASISARLRTRSGCSAAQTRASTRVAG